MKLDFRAIDITGQRFGMLVAIEPVPSKARMVHWRCICDCGNEKIVYGGSLRRNKTKSCGCLVHRPRIVKIKHGKTGTKTYRAWSCMIQRCTNPNNPKWEIYGKRGIKVCDQWFDFENFLHDMGESPEGLTLGRINNDGHYEPSNCRWETPKQQANNKRNNRLITFDGKTMNESQWADYLGISYVTIRMRLHRKFPLHHVFNKNHYDNSKKRKQSLLLS